MVSTKELLSIIESALLGPSPPTPAQRVELLHAIRSSLPAFQSLLSYPPLKPSDRAQVQSREVRLPDSPPILLDDQDVQILSGFILCSLNNTLAVFVKKERKLNGKKVGFDGTRAPGNFMPFSRALVCGEKRSIDCPLYTIKVNFVLQAVVLDQGLDVDLLCDVQKYLEDLMSSGLRQRLILLIKVLHNDKYLFVHNIHLDMAFGVRALDKKDLDPSFKAKLAKIATAEMISSKLLFDSKFWRRMVRLLAEVLPRQEKGRAASPLLDRNKKQKLVVICLKFNEVFYSYVLLKRKLNRCVYKRKVHMSKSLKGNGRGPRHQPCERTGDEMSTAMKVAGEGNADNSDGCGASRC
ncbi:hypothetical protein L484_001746 [Morus notabilis]|uniref:Uncharacterized protein n=1 Tax=Morus notabilis TaxID=981085 RepID=W9QZS9_9ROSA|nr:hypothetical protein L484_001746 [Morus notabilis]